MRVLMISPRLPYPPSTGARLRTFHLLKGLATRHDVTLLAIFDDPAKAQSVTPLKQYCGDVVTVFVPTSSRPLTAHVGGLLSATPYYRAVVQSAAFQDRVFALMRDKRYDAVQVEHLGMAHFAARLSGVRKLLNMPDVESIYFRRLAMHMRPGINRLLTSLDAVKLPSYMRKVIHRFDRCLATSDADADEIRRLVPSANVVVIPNGVDPLEFSPRPDEEQPARIVFTGTLSYFPNADAMVFFCRNVFPIVRRAVPDLRLTIVGQEPPPEVTALEGVQGVEVTGRVPDVRPYLAAAAVAVVPLRLGSGTRLKILEAMAMAKAVVSTSLGAEGLDVTPGHDIEIADTPAAFAERLIALCRDPARRGRLGAHARHTISEKYAWPTISARLESVYQELIEDRRPSLAERAPGA